VNQQLYRNLAVWVVVLVMILLVLTMLRQGKQAPEELAYSEFLDRVEAEQVESVVIEENQILVNLTDGSERTTFAPAVTDELLDQLHASNVKISARP
jgi:cell division protease FtsH